MHEMCELYGLQGHATNPQLGQQAQTAHNHAHLDAAVLLLFRLPTDRMTLHNPHALT
jgi:hypothetical protein